MRLSQLLSGVVGILVASSILVSSCTKDAVVSCEGQHSIGCPAVTYELLDANGKSIFAAPGALLPDSVLLLQKNLYNGQEESSHLPVYNRGGRVLLGPNTNFALCSSPMGAGAVFNFVSYLKVGAVDVDTIKTEAVYGPPPCGKCTNMGPLLELAFYYNGRLVRRYNHTVCADSTELFRANATRLGRVLKLYKR